VLTDLDINLAEKLLSGKVNGAGPVALLDLVDSRLKIRAQRRVRHRCAH
jgi:hypothetical protein